MTVDENLKALNNQNALNQFVTYINMGRDDISIIYNLYKDKFTLSVTNDGFTLIIKNYEQEIMDTIKQLGMLNKMELIGIKKRKISH